MDERLKQLADDIQDQLGLCDAYQLVRHELYPEKNILHDTHYIVTLEWQPTADQVEEAYNPPGTAIVDVDLHTKTVRRLVFVHETSFADTTKYPEASEPDVIEWIEDVTGLTYGKQFTVAHSGEEEFAFAAAVDHIPVSPSGWIEVEFEDGMLTMFTMDGHFPAESEVKWEPFSLTFEKIATIAQKQCRRIDIPLEDEGKWLPLYTIEETFVKNDGKTTISYESLEKLGTAIDKNSVITWNDRDETPFERQELDLALETTVEDAFNNVAHPDTLPITADIAEACTAEVQRFLQRVFPEDSGLWRLVGLRRENGYIFADVKPVDAGSEHFQRKLQIALYRTTYEAINVIDNKMLIDMFKDYTPADKPTLSAENAFTELQQDIEVMPTYVYDQELGQYVLCGKLDCLYGINATTGERIELNTL
ncbi:hypothetical protein [Lentibacillus saliphilus]|uniref:hypothetical protein n=1 Tax=Lentibacillus saliphilus TaxID=2737028 RepID=UPI001C30E0A9|nr:hypothetical protein [Lentibacillus saliphilus]